MSRMVNPLNFIGIDKIVRGALNEDIGTGDITTMACVPQDNVSTANLIAKSWGVLCGMPVFARVFEMLDPSIRINCFKNDGDEVADGDLIAVLEGKSRNILTGERVALNFLQRLSGIASRTALAVKFVEGTKVKIVDTRKTTPGLRTLEKYAVRVGGGYNHRFCLADGVLIKDNHIKAAGSITKAIANAREFAPHTFRVEVECEDMAQIDEALLAGADIIMLDNMTLEEMQAAVEHINGQAKVEASGNMGSRDLTVVASTGVDYISIGALSHSASALDISLKFVD